MENSHAAPAYIVEIGPMTDVLDDNVDVVVLFADRRRYTATFFTIANIHSIMERHRASGECANGLYFWASDCIIVRELSRYTIETTVQQLLHDRQLHSAFSRIEDHVDE